MYVTTQALFLPSGVMAQQIALLIHYHAPQNTSSPVGRSFVCHYSSHILLHEKDTCSHLLNMKSLVIEAVPKTRDQPPVSFNDVQAKLDWAAQKPCAVVLECPHREIGGKCTSYADLERISELCRSRCVAFHMDGARLWEAVAHYTTGTTAAGKAVTAQDLCSLFDSIYVSCYKGIGGMTGAVLLGSATFIAEARVWLRRFGGNVFTLLPYAVSSYASYRNYVAWNSNSRDLGTAAAGAVTGASAEDSALSTSEPPYSMQARRQRMQHIVALLSAQPSLQEYVRFDPPVPQVCLVHVYILTDAATAMRALEVSRAQTGIACFARVRPAPEIAGVDASSFVDECYFEFNMVSVTPYVRVCRPVPCCQHWTAFNLSREGGV